MGGRRLKKKVELARISREEILAAAPRGTCCACECNDQPISSAPVSDAVEADPRCRICGLMGVCWCVRNDLIPRRWVCFDCQDRWSSWAIRVGRVIQAVEARVSSTPSAGIKIVKLTALLESEEWDRETPHLDRWLKKLKIAA